jgi:5-bromo-4-chloroindolyl phosphate hydrolysis protein
MMTRNEARTAINYGEGIEYETKNFVNRAFVQVEKVYGVAKRVFCLTETAKDTQCQNEYVYDDIDALLHSVSETAPIGKWNAARTQVQL